MVAGVAGQGGVIALNVELELVREAVLVQEAHRGGSIPVILVLCWLLRSPNLGQPSFVKSHADTT